MKIETTLSRRRLLASVPAVAAAGVPSVATALGGLAADPDPIFAAIERHREAFAVYSNTGEVHIRVREEHEAQRDPRSVYLGEGQEVEYVRIIREIGENRCVLPAQEIHTGRMVPTFAVCLPDIDRYASAHLKDCTDIEAWKAEKTRAWHHWHGIDDGLRSTWRGLHGMPLAMS